MRAVRVGISSLYYMRMLLPNQGSIVLRTKAARASSFHCWAILRGDILVQIVHIYNSCTCLLLDILGFVSVLHPVSYGHPFAAAVILLYHCPGMNSTFLEIYSY
jgi:hypothetical protein